MADVFDGVPLEKHTGQGTFPLPEMRAKYGSGLTYTADPAKKRIKRGWERSQTETITLHFEDAQGNPVEGIEGRYFWPVDRSGSPPGGFAVKSDANGNINWTFDNKSYYNARIGEVGPFSFETDGLTIRGLGSPSKDTPHNHDSMSFDIVVNPAGPAPEPPDPEPEPEPDPGPGPGPQPGRIYMTVAEANELRHHSTAIDSLVQRIVNRPPGG